MERPDRKQKGDRSIDRNAEEVCSCTAKLGESTVVSTCYSCHCDLTNASRAAKNTKYKSHFVITAGKSNSY